MHNDPIGASSLLSRLHFSNDLSVALQARLKDSVDQSVLAFYDRSKRSWVSQSQTQLLRRAGAFGVDLRQAGVESGTHVVVACASPEAALLGFTAALFIGAIPTILPIRSAFDGRDAINARVADALKLLGQGTAVVIERKNGKAAVAEVADVICAHLDLAAIDSLTDFSVLDHTSYSDISHIQLTSGSTGAGKGVAVTHSNVLSNVSALQERGSITRFDTCVTWLPLYHDMGLMFQLMTLLIGADSYVLSPFDFLSDPALWVRTMSEKAGSVTSSPAFGYDLVSKKVTTEELSRLDLSRWKTACCGAEPISADVARNFYETFAACGLREAAFTPSYGLAEATVAVTATAAGQPWHSVSVSRTSISRLGELELVDLTSPEAVEVVALGTPVDGVGISLVDADGKKIDGELMCGEILVTGESVSAGWVLDGGEIAGFPNGELPTGDIGFRYDGELFVVERTKNIVIRNGHNYSAQILEITLAELAAVTPDNVLVLDRDIATGSGLTGVVEIDKGLDPQVALGAVLGGVDRFEPPLESIIFVKRGSLPQTTSGKKRHIAVREAINAGSLRIEAEYDLSASAASASKEIARELAALGGKQDLNARNQDEETLLEIIAEDVRGRGLDVPVVMSSRLQHDLDFDSLGLLELAMHIEEAFSVELAREVVAEIKTVRDMMSAIASAQECEGSTGGLTSSFQKLKDQVPQYYTVVEDVRPNREVQVDGRWMTDFASCSYLGLEEREEMFEAINQWHRKWGLSRWSTRAVGLAKPVLDIEDRIAEVLGVPNTMVFPTITLLHIGVLPVLAGTDGAIIIDTAAHKSMQEAAILARGKGTAVTAFKYGDLADLEAKLQRMSSKARRIVVLDGVYSMSGQLLDLPAYQALAEKYDALLYVDDAHGFGVIGEDPSESAPYGHKGNGIVKYNGCTYDRTFYIGGLGKAYSTALAFISCPTPEYRQLFHTAAPVIFGTLASTATLAQANTALDLNESEGDELRADIHRLATRLIDGAQELGFDVEGGSSQVVNIVVGDIDSVITATNVLWDDAIKITPSMFPAAPLDRGGLRFTVTATNTDAQVDKVLKSLARLREIISPAVIDITDAHLDAVLSKERASAQ